MINEVLHKVLNKVFYEKNAKAKCDRKAHLDIITVS